MDACPWAGWCPTIYSLQPVAMITGVCQSAIHEKCDIFLKFDNDIRMPKEGECLCKIRCYSEGCARSDQALDLNRHAENYKNCLCGECEHEFCFPLLAPGEERPFVYSLSEANFARLVAAMEPMMERQKKH